MSQAKGKRDVVKSVDAIQQLIFKPEWKSLVNSVIEDENLTERALEHVVSVANAIVTPLSLLIYAVELPEAQIEQCRTLWVETMKHVGAKCMNKEVDDKGIQVESEQIPTESSEPTSNLKTGNQVGPKSTSVFRRISFSSENDALDDPADQQEPDPEKNQDESSSQSETSSSDSEKDPVEIANMNEASNLLKQGKSSRTVLAAKAAKKGLLDVKTFHQKARLNSSKV